MELREKRAWQNFYEHVDTSKLNLRRIENIIGDGMPDVIGENRRGSVFWIENKAIEFWPKMDKTFPLKSVFEPGQVPFMRSWIQWGGNAFVLLRVGGAKCSEFYLMTPHPFDPREMTRLEIESLSIVGRPAIRNHLENL
jgi:hypothetical protein